MHNETAKSKRCTLISRPTGFVWPLALFAAAPAFSKSQNEVHARDQALVYSHCNKVTWWPILRRPSVVPREPCPRSSSSNDSLCKQTGARAGPSPLPATPAAAHDFPEAQRLSALPVAEERLRDAPEVHEAHHPHHQPTAIHSLGALQCPCEVAIAFVQDWLQHLHSGTIARVM